MTRKTGQSFQFCPQDVVSVFVIDVVHKLEKFWDATGLKYTKIFFKNYEWILWRTLFLIHLIYNIFYQNEL